MQNRFQTTEHPGFNKQIDHLVAFALQALCGGVIPFTNRFSDRLVAPAHNVVGAADPPVRAGQQAGGEDLVITVVEHQIRMFTTDLLHLEEIAGGLLQRADARQRHQRVDLIQR